LKNAHLPFDGLTALSFAEGLRCAHHSSLRRTKNFYSDHPENRMPENRLNFSTSGAISAASISLSAGDTTGRSIGFLKGLLIFLAAYKRNRLFVLLLSSLSMNVRLFLFLV